MPLLKDQIRRKMVSERSCAQDGIETKENSKHVGKAKQASVLLNNNNGSD